jgi:hypothetical protein
MTRTDALAIRSQQLQGHDVDSELAAAALAAIKTGVFDPEPEPPVGEVAVKVKKKRAPSTHGYFYLPQLDPVEKARINGIMIQKFEKILKVYP